MATLKFDLRELNLVPCEGGNSFIETPEYSDFYVFLDTSVVKYLTDCQHIIALNNMFLIIETENDEHWRISHRNEEGGFWGCVVGGKIIKKVEEKIKILCSEADIKFSTSRVYGIDN